MEPKLEFFYIINGNEQSTRPILDLSKREHILGALEEEEEATKNLWLIDAFINIVEPNANTFPRSDKRKPAELLIKSKINVTDIWLMKDDESIFVFP
ncbi:hypothetical protein ACWU4D_04365 [Vibrio sp. WJH972]